MTPRARVSKALLLGALLCLAASTLAQPSASDPRAVTPGRAGSLTIRYPNGTFYEGTMRNGAPHGHGKFRFADGGYYEGEVRQGKLHGKGKSIAANGDRHEGEYQDNHYHGKGIAYYASGAVYEGEFLQGLWHGRGKLRSARRDYVFVGSFVHGRIKGHGVLSVAGATMEGEFDGAELRRGRITTADGTRVEIDKQAGSRARLDAI